MTGVDLPPFSPAIVIVFLALYAISCSKLVNRVLQCLSFRPNEEAKRIYPHIAKGISFKDASFSKASTSTVEKELEFSSDWWLCDNIFQLERRAIFSKTWIYAAHRSVFIKPGDYLTLNLAGISFFLILGKDNVLRAFHNVCRHRAYEVTRKERGSSTILGCRYHGWSYDTKGQLTKAPEFDTVPEFDKKKNGLWEILVRVSAQGLVLVNFDTAKIVNDPTARVLGLEIEYSNISQVIRIADWRFEGKLNWKLAVSSGSTNADPLKRLRCDRDNYESIFGRLSGVSKWKRRLCWQVDLLTTIQFYPGESFYVIVKLMPQSATKTIIGYEIFTMVARDPLSIERSSRSIKKRSFTEIGVLQRLQEQLMEGQHLVLDHEQTNQQKSINALLGAHRKLERLEGMEINPAAHQISLSENGRKDVDRMYSIRLLTKCANKNKSAKNLRKVWATEGLAQEKPQLTALNGELKYGL